MEQKDAQLIQRILQGDQESFSSLVRKYQKGVHALVWRKIGDFHIAQEITQDAFLTAYKKLRTLKNHNQFAGWLYVIAANLCRDYLRRKRLPMESLDADNTNEVDKVSYSQYVADKQKTDADETRREIVKELLKKLPESERTVMTLHYLGEMTIQAISEFLGVSPNTVKSRLSRARNRLRKEEDVIQQNLGSFQLPDTFAANIMQEVSRIAPVPPAVSKPVAPLAISAASAVLIFLMMGVGTQYLSRFQRPYNLDATSEPTIEIIDAVFVYDSPAKPAVRSQAGSSALPGKSPGAGQKPDDSLAATLPVDTIDVSTPKPQWTQTKGPEGGTVNNLFMTSNGDTYARIGTDLYRLTDDRSTWKPANIDGSTQGSWQMVEHQDTLYIVSGTEVMASADRGRTWNSLGTRPEGQLIGTLITDEAPGAQANTVMYLGLVNGVFRSVDAGKSWTSLTDGKLTDRKIQAITAIENTLFVGTDNGLYRHSSDGWEQLQLPVTEAENISALANADHRLYVAVGQGVTPFNFPIGISGTTNNTSLSLYRSIDLGDSWQTIDFTKAVSEANDEFMLAVAPANPQPDDTSETEKIASVKMVAAQERLLVVYGGKSYYSNDAGETWLSLGVGTAAIGETSITGVSDANTFYKSGSFGIQRTTDAGKTWQPFSTGLVRTGVDKLIYANNTLYAKTATELVASLDGGESWTRVSHPEIAILHYHTDMPTSMMKFNDILYVKGIKKTAPQLFRVAAENNGLVPVSGMPSLEGIDIETLTSETVENALIETLTNETVENALRESVQDELKKNIEKGTELKPEDFGLKPGDFGLKPEDFDMDMLSTVASEVIEKSMIKLIQIYLGSFAVSGSTYYMEYNQQLFRWKPGMTEWFNTGLADAGESIRSIAALEDQGSIDFKIGVSGKTIYVGKRDGHLLQSFDEGDTWNDVTTNLPFSVTHFKAIAFAGPTLYVATDKGVTYSSDGTRWHTATDAEGTPFVIEKIAVDGTTVYGATEQQIYQLKENSSTWKHVTPEVPIKITSLAVEGNTLYVGTPDHGVLRFKLD